MSSFCVQKFVWCLSVHFHIFHQNCWMISLVFDTGVSKVKAVILLCVCARQLIELSAMTCGASTTSDKPNVVFQHDRAPPHIQYELATFLNRQLPEQCFSWGGFTSWPLWSPGLTLLNFLLWGFVKDEVYILPIPNPTWLQGMNTNSNCKNWTWHEVVYYLDVCRATNGAPTELHRVWKK